MHADDTAITTDIKKMQKLVNKQVRKIEIIMIKILIVFIQKIKK